MRKLPPFGIVTNVVFDKQWPKKKDLRRIMASGKKPTAIKRILYKECNQDSACLGAIQIELDDGSQSPIFYGNN